MCKLFDNLFAVYDLYASPSEGEHPTQCICSSSGCTFTIYTANGTRLIGGKEELKSMVAELPYGVKVVATALLHVVGEVRAVKCAGAGCGSGQCAHPRCPRHTTHRSRSCRVRY